MIREAGMEGLGRGLEFLQEPALVLDLEGRVRGANSAARSLLDAGLDKDGPCLFDFVLDNVDNVAAYLQRASGSTSSHLGSLTVAHGAHEERFRALTARVPSVDSTETLLILRLMPVRDDQFSVLNRRLREMDRQLHQRLKENALLTEALAENKVLLSELQHRVKNNIQQMLSLIKMSAGDRSSSDVAALVMTASNRLQAMSLTQEALYQNSAARYIEARSFLEDVVTSSSWSHGVSDKVLISIGDGRMTAEEAHCLALIANELVTNACKHGIAGSSGTIRVRFTSLPDGLCLLVQDEGQGFDVGASARSSGLMLVRALCRQIGAKLEITLDQGTQCVVQFRSELTAENDYGSERECH